MKVAAHPMLVAVALGLLGPNALASDPVEDDGVRRSTASPTDRAAAGVEEEQVMSALEDDTGPYWTQLSLVSDEADSWSTDSEG